MDIRLPPGLAVGLAAATANSPDVVYNQEKIASQRLTAYNVCMESRGYTHPRSQS